MKCKINRLVRNTQIQEQRKKIENIEKKRGQWKMVERSNLHIFCIPEKEERIEQKKKMF